jgi:hypothetical protein
MSRTNIAMQGPAHGCALVLQVVAEYVMAVDRSQGTVDVAGAAAGRAPRQRQPRGRGTSRGSEAALQTVQLYNKGMSIADIASSQVRQTAAAAGRPAGCSMMTVHSRASHAGCNMKKPCPRFPGSRLFRCGCLYAVPLYSDSRLSAKSQLV